MIFSERAEMDGFLLFAPYPASKLTQLDRIKELTQDSKVVNIFNDDKGESEITTGDDIDMSDDENEYDGPEKKQRLDDSDINVCLEEALKSHSSLKSIWEKFKTKEPEILNDNIIEMFLRTVPRIGCEKEVVSQLCEKYLSKSLLHYECDADLLYEDLTNFVSAFPHTAFSLAHDGVVDRGRRWETWIVSVTEGSFLTEDQERSLLTRWMTAHALDGSSRLVEVCLARSPALYEDPHLMGLVADNMARNLAQLKDKCPKFSKFLLQIVTKLPPTMDTSVCSTLRAVVETNKTFLKKRMEQEMKKFQS